MTALFTSGSSDTSCQTSAVWFRIITAGRSPTLSTDDSHGSPSVRSFDVSRSYPNIKMMSGREQSLAGSMEFGRYLDAKTPGVSTDSGFTTGGTCQAHDNHCSTVTLLRRGSAGVCTSFFYHHSRRGRVGWERFGWGRKAITMVIFSRCFFATY